MPPGSVSARASKYRCAELKSVVTQAASKMPSTATVLRRSQPSSARAVARDLTEPDHTTFARRSPGLTLATALARAQASGGPVDVVIDATGLKVHGAGEWLAERHGGGGARGGGES